MKSPVVSLSNDVCGGEMNKIYILHIQATLHIKIHYRPIHKKIWSLSGVFMRVADLYHTQVLTQLGQRSTPQSEVPQLGISRKLTGPHSVEAQFHSYQLHANPWSQSAQPVEFPPALWLALLGILTVLAGVTMPYLSFLGSICAQRVFKPRIHATCCELSFQEKRHNLCLKIIFCKDAHGCKCIPEYSKADYINK